MNKKISLVCASVCALVLLVASGCSMKKNMDEMHDATVVVPGKLDDTSKKIDHSNDQMGDMRGKMDQSNEQMEDMRRKMDKSNEQMEDMRRKMDQSTAAMCNMYQDMRQAAARTLRKDSLKSLGESDDQAGKISDAGVYMMAFEFQLIKGAGCSNELVLDAYKLQAAEEFFREARNFGSQYHSLDIASKSSNNMALAALAVALHRVNPNAEALAEMQKQDKNSMMKIIEQTLQRKPLIDAGRVEAKEFEREILTNHDEAVYLLQLRSNFLGAMVLEKLTSISQMGRISKFRARYTRGASADLSILNVSEMETFSIWIEEAQRVRTFLKGLGYRTPYDSNLVGIYNRMDIFKTETRELRGDTGKHRAKFEARLAGGIEKFRSWK